MFADYYVIKNLQNLRVEVEKLESEKKNYLKNKEKIKF